MIGTAQFSMAWSPTDYPPILREQREIVGGIG